MITQRGDKRVFGAPVNVKNVLGPIYPDSFISRFLTLFVLGVRSLWHQQKFRDSIRSSGIEFASSKPGLESTLEPCCERGESRGGLD